MRKITNIFLIMITMVLAAGLLISIGAQDEKPAPKRSSRGMDISLSKEEIPHLVEIIRIWKLVDELGLDEDQMIAFLPKFRKYNSIISRYYGNRREAEIECAQLLEEDAPETQLKSITEKFRNMEVEFSREYRQTRDALEASLNVKQRAQFIVFDAKYRDDMRRLIKTLRELSSQRESKQKHQPVPLKQQKTK